MARPKAVGLERHKTEIGTRSFDRRFDGGGAFRLEVAIFLEQKAGTKHEVAGIPKIAVGHIARRRFGVRLFDETFYGKQSRRKRRAGADITVFDRRPRRLHAKHDDPVVLRRVACSRAHLSEGERISHDVIGRKSNDDRIVAAPQCTRRTRCDGRTGIPTHRLEQDICLRTNRRQLLGHQKTVLTASYDNGAIEQIRIGDAANGLLEGR